MPDESFKLILLKDEFIIGSLTGEIKVFDLSSMMLKKIIYAFQGKIMHLLVNDNFIAIIGYDFTSRLGLHAQLKVFDSETKKLQNTISISKPVKQTKIFQIFR